jgi:hypothetical protein
MYGHVVDAPGAVCISGDSAALGRISRVILQQFPSSRNSIWNFMHGGWAGWVWGEPVPTL